MEEKVMLYILGIIAALSLVSQDKQISKLEVLEASRQQLIEECEKSLPRDKTCKLVAVEEHE